MSGASISYPHHQQPAQMGKQQQRCVASYAAHQSSTDYRPAKMAATTCYVSSPYELSPQIAAPAPQVVAARQQTVQVPKDYSRPLHVDCSVEYELPNTAKPPQGVRNEPLLMIHPCYFRKIESQRRSPFINNLPPMRPAAAPKKRVQRVQQPQVIQQVPQTASQYPVQYAQWEAMPPIVPMTPYTKRDPYASAGGDSANWTDPERSPDRPEDKHILSGKYRQYLRAHRLHPYVGGAAVHFPQLPQVCYNV